MSKKSATKATAAKSGAISGRMPPVAVEYDANGKRATKNFEDPMEAKAFYVAKHKAGKNPMVIGELAEQVTSDAPTPKAAEKSNSDAKPARTPKEPKDDAGRDTLGSRLGSQAAKINACISEKPKTAADIAKGTGLAVARIKSHFKHLVKKGYVTDTEQGVVLKKAGVQ